MQVIPGKAITGFTIYYCFYRCRWPPISLPLYKQTSLVMYVPICVFLPKLLFCHAIEEGLHNSVQH